MPLASSNARPYTPTQVALVERVCAHRRDAYYEILEVQEHADEADIKRAFKSLALQLHPDKNAAPGAEEAFKLVAEAWEVLGNVQERAGYDNDRLGGFGSFDSSRSYAASNDFEYDDSPAFTPRTPPPNETRKQRRNREFQERQARQRAKQQAQRAARAEERARRQARFGDIDDLLRHFASQGMRFGYCDHCNRLHLFMDDDDDLADEPPTRPHAHAYPPRAPGQSGGAFADGDSHRSAPSSHRTAEDSSRSSGPRRPQARSSQPQSTTVDPKKQGWMLDCLDIGIALAIVAVCGAVVYKVAKLLYTSSRVRTTVGIGVAGAFLYYAAGRRQVRPDGQRRSG